MPLPLAESFAAASRAAQAVAGTTSPNPPVGAVVLRDGRVVGIGATQPAGGPHAEIVALRDAGDRARGATVVVTLEPCNHWGRTGPCARALRDAGVREVFFAHHDPGRRSGGGAEFLRDHGVAATQVAAPTPELEPWLIAHRRGRPCVTAKIAQTLDGFTAALDGTSQWITGETARRRVHLDRSRRDAIVVGTGTVLSDDCSLTARDGEELYPHQPRRIVVGRRRVPEGNLRRLGFEQYPDPGSALRALWESGARDVLVEGGTTLRTSFMRAGFVDRVQAYVAPMLFGGGRGAIEDALVGSLAEASRWQLCGIERLGEDVLIEIERRD